MKLFSATQAEGRIIPKSFKSGLGRFLKVFEIGEAIQLAAERKKFRKRPGIAITHIKYEQSNGTCSCAMIYRGSHLYKLNERKVWALILAFNRSLKCGFWRSGFNLET